MHVEKKILPAQFLTFALLVAFIAACVFTPGLPGEFIFDDIPNIVDNSSIQIKTLDLQSILQIIATPQISGDMRGIPTLSFAVDYSRAGGAHPATFKVTNIAIHALTAFALCWLFKSLLALANIDGKKVAWLSAALALAWAVHPLQVSAVLYVVQRIQTLGTMFLVFALLAYLTARRRQISGLKSRTWFLGTAFLWILALDCKEDSALLPAYTLALEFTLLNFQAATESGSKNLKRIYICAVLSAAAVYLFWIVPHYWRWDAYPGRDFSTSERLLTQARVLCIYLWQIVFPLPSHMPFFYDWLVPSRGLFQPWTTFTSIAILFGLAIAAWVQRLKRPLFALGVMIFFCAHFIASNVIGLEMAFEHRNSFALIGAVLAIGSLFGQIAVRLRIPLNVQYALIAAILGALCIGAGFRAYTWRNNVSWAEASANAAPTSARAWIQLCAARFKLDGRLTKENKQLDAAIDACSSGSTLAPYALNDLALLVVLKTVRGDVSKSDWNSLQHRIQTMQLSWDNKRAINILIHHAQLGVALDKNELLTALNTLVHRTEFDSYTMARFGYFVLNTLNEPDSSMPYFLSALNQASPTDPFPEQLAGDLRKVGRSDLARQIEVAGMNRRAAGYP